jgi:hypothetical protein
MQVIIVGYGELVLMKDAAMKVEVLTFLGTMIIFIL